MRFPHLCTLVLSALLCLPALAEDAPASPPEKQADIRKLMDIMGTGNLPRQLAASGSRRMFQALKTARPETPERAQEVMQQELAQLLAENMDGSGGLNGRIVPVYDKHFTHEEIRELLAFYQTSLGRKTLGVMPRVNMESLVATQQWLASLRPEIDRRVTEALRREGLLPQSETAPEQQNK